uniref:Uncharacterized protein n=1 Tax=Panagrolaimus davidi TaxID=227884 RepID=A0A914Q5X7_9BILA
MNHFLPHIRQRSRNHESRRRQSLPSLTSYSMINTSLTNADELPPPRISMRKFSADNFSSMDYFSSMNLSSSSSSNNVNNPGILAPVKTGAAALMPTNFNESEGGNGDTNEHNRSSAIIKEEVEETDDDDLNQGFIVEDKDIDFSNVLNCIRKSIFHRRESLLTHQKPVSSVKKVAVENDTVNDSLIEHPSLFASSSSPEPSDTIDDLEKEFERLKVNMEVENITTVLYKNITEEYLEKFSNEESQRRSLQAQLNEKNEEIEVLKTQLSAEKENNASVAALKNENEMLKRNLEEINCMKIELFKIIESCGDDMKSLTMFNGDIRSFITIENSEIIKLVRLLLQYMSL